MTDNSAYRIELRVPAIDDYMRLRLESGLTPFSREAAEKGLPNSIFGVSLMLGDETVGMGRIIGDGGCFFFQVTDIAILPGHQGRGLAKWIMQALSDFIATLPKTAYVSLIADVPANRLYSQFGFDETAPRSVGMARRVL